MDTHDDQPDVAAPASAAAAPKVEDTHHVFPLQTPITVGNLTISEIRIPRKLQGKHAAGHPSLATAGEFDLLMHVISRAAEVPIDVVHEVEMTDLMRIFAAVGAQMGNLLATPRR